MVKVEIIGKSNCMYCTMAKQLLEKNNIEYTYKSLDQDITLLELRERLPDVRSVPVIFINDEFIGGYNSLEAYFRNADKS